MQAVADKLKLLRDVDKQNVTDATTDVERFRNVNAKPYDLEIGQHVFVSQLLKSSKTRYKNHQLHDSAVLFYMICKAISSHCNIFIAANF